MQVCRRTPYATSIHRKNKNKKKNFVKDLYMPCRVVALIHKWSLRSPASAAIFGQNSDLNKSWQKGRLGEASVQMKGAFSGTGLT